MPRLPLLLVVLAGCAGAPTGPSSSPLPSACEPSSDVPPGRIARVTVTPEAAGTWLVEYAFARPESNLAFALSRGDYRRASWTSLGGGVRLHREGTFDMISLDPAATRARFRVAPYAGYIPAGYDPVLDFGGGNRAIYVDQFQLVRVPDAETLAAHPGDGHWDGEWEPFTFVLDTDGPVIAAGELLDGPVSFDSQRPIEYVYYGSGDLAHRPNYVAVVDPRLPAWMRDSFDADLDEFFEALEDGFGSPLPQRANVLVAYGDRDTPGESNSGGVLPGHALVLQVRGSRNDTLSAAGRARWRRLVSHEAAHLFQYRDGPVPVAEGWIHEGHAEAVAFHLVPEGRERQERTIESCRRALQSGEPLPEQLRGQGWACGTWVWTLAGRLAPYDDVFTVWDRMVETAAGSRARAEHLVSALRTAGAEGDEFDALGRALRGDASVDVDHLLFGSGEVSE